MTQEIRRAVWEGQLPVCFRLATQEVAAMAAPPPYYAMLNRQSYFPLIYDKLRAHFQSSAPAHTHAQEDLWLEASSEPLRWHLPVGTLFDMLTSSDVSSMPWQITVHFLSFPGLLNRQYQRIAIDTFC
jgi:autophagy-related protein 5